jgi:hypothetical protein
LSRLQPHALVPLLWYTPQTPHRLNSGKQRGSARSDSRSKEVAEQFTLSKNGTAFVFLGFVASSFLEFNFCDVDGPIRNAIASAHSVYIFGFLADVI